jgi:hypothetical protein
MSLLRQVNAWLFDGAGTAIVADKSGGIRVNNEAQTALHDGNLFSFFSNGTISGGSSIILLGKVGAKQVHFDWFVVDVSQGAFLVEFFESPTVTSNGTAQIVSKRNRASLISSTLALYSGATVSANGTLMSSDKLLSIGTGAKVLSGSAGIDDGWVLKSNTDYIIKLTNQESSTTSFNAKFVWHEPSYMV